METGASADREIDLARLTQCCGVVLVVVSWAAAATSVQATQERTGFALAPHRAVYDMTLAASGAGAGIAALRGRMVFELKGNACDGFEQNMRFVTQTTNRRGKPTLTDQRSLFRENAASGKFRFESSQYRNDRLAEAVEGAATRTKDGLKVKIELQRPSSKQISVDRPVVFPVEHSIRLLEAARAGRKIYAADIYDGSEKGAKVFATTAVLGAKRLAGINASLKNVKSAASLDGLAAWPVSLSYFEIGGKKQDAVPVYELSFLFFENGVSRKLFIDYGSFSMHGQLRSLKMYPVKACEK